MPKAVRDLSFQTTLIRATEWLARREILYPVPGEFNTESRIIYRDILLPWWRRNRPGPGPIPSPPPVGRVRTLSVYGAWTAIPWNFAVNPGPDKRIQA